MPELPYRPPRKPTQFQYQQGQAFKGFGCFLLAALVSRDIGTSLWADS